MELGNPKRVQSIGSLKKAVTDDAAGTSHAVERGSIDFTVQPDEDSSLAIEGDAAESMRVIASTMPRKLEDE